MKRLFLLIITIGVVLFGNAQKVKNVGTGLRQKTVKAQTLDAVLGSIDNINHQIDSLKDFIHSEYQGYNTQKLYTDKKFRNDTLANIDREKEALQNKIKEDISIVYSLKEEYKSVDRLREFYDKGNIDTLYAHADQITLCIHKKIFGNDYPKIMDDLQVLLECAELLAQGYDEKKNKASIQNLKGVRQCDTKELLEGLLLVQKDVSDEVNSWIKDEEHTLYSLVMFRKYLFNNYGITLDADFPYLSAKVTEIVKLPSSAK